jgi:hypothetical protein
MIELGGATTGTYCGASPPPLAARAPAANAAAAGAASHTSRSFLFASIRSQTRRTDALFPPGRRPNGSSRLRLGFEPAPLTVGGPVRTAPPAPPLSGLSTAQGHLVGELLALPLDTDS